MIKICFGAILLLFLNAYRLSAQAGPPFQTDDPTPVDLGHYEAYIFGTVDGTPAEYDPVGPAFEFNWGAIPNVQLHATGRILDGIATWPVTVNRGSNGCESANTSRLRGTDIGRVFNHTLRQYCSNASLLPE
jgi:hypothetical protein